MSDVAYPRLENHLKALSHRKCQTVWRWRNHAGTKSSQKRAESGRPDNQGFLKRAGAVH